MQQAIPKEIFNISAFGHNTINMVESIKKYINDNDCPTLSMDISRLNIIDASKVTILCSTYHWAKYPDGEISWKISTDEVKNLVNPRNLGNIRLITAQ
jgi:ABC-type transporter Mla MlaB component